MTPPPTPEPATADRVHLADLVAALRDEIAAPTDEELARAFAVLRGPSTASDAKMGP